MKQIDERNENNRRLENIELLLKSIDYQLAKLLQALSVQPASTVHPRKPNRLLSTKEASEMFGISEYELRRGFKAGVYPAIEIGSGDQFHKIKWNPDQLEAALRKKEEEHEH